MAFLYKLIYDKAMDSYHQCLAHIVTHSTPRGANVIDLEITSACHLSCQFCPFHSPLLPGHRDIVHMPFEKIQHILDTAQSWQTREVIISADGEPTLHPHFVNIIDYALSKKLFVILTTNGVFSKDLLPIIARIQQIDINISASSQKLYSQLQAPLLPDAFQTLLYNLKFLKKLKTKYSAPKVNLVYVINALNFHDIENIFFFAQEHEIPKIFFRLMVPRKNTAQIALSDEQKKILLAKIDQIHLKTNLIAHNLEELKPQLSSRKISTAIPCYEGWYNIYINRFLRVSLCCLNQRLYCGNLNNESLDALWKSQKAHSLRNLCQYHFQSHNSRFHKICFWCLSRKEHAQIHHDLMSYQKKYFS